jgi:hypothetical protein
MKQTLSDRKKKKRMCVLCKKHKALINSEFCSQCDGYKRKGIIKYGGRDAGVLYY